MASHLDAASFLASFRTQRQPTRFEGEIWVTFLYRRVAYSREEDSLRGPEGRIWPDDFWKKNPWGTEIKFSQRRRQHCFWQALCIAQKCTHLERLPPLLVNYYCWVTVYSPNMEGKKKSQTGVKPPGIEIIQTMDQPTTLFGQLYLMGRTECVNNDD